MIVARKKSSWPRALLLRSSALVLFVAALAGGAHAYSVLSHEEVVDMSWTGQMLPLLKRRFPGLTDEQIQEAHAYAYGGSVIQDIGYYPFGDKEFSDLLPYVRTGDFVTALLRDVATPDELAFALGALAPYYGDTIGHPIVNLVTAEEFPALRMLRELLYPARRCRRGEAQAPALGRVAGFLADPATDATGRRYAGFIHARCTWRSPCGQSHAVDWKGRVFCPKASASRPSRMPAAQQRRPATLKICSRIGKPASSE